MIKKNLKKTKAGKLSANLVDEFSSYAEEMIAETGLPEKDILRFRLSVDTAMYMWLKEIGDGAECSMELHRRFGRSVITLACEGKKCNPQKQEEDFYAIENSSFLQSIGLSVKYSYEDGVNRLKLMPGSGFVLKLMPIFIAFALGVGMAVFLKTLFPAFADSLNTTVVDPVFSALMNILRTIASPLIFLSVLSGIYSIGDLASLSTIGKKLMSRFVLMTFVTLGVTLAILMTIMKIDIAEQSTAGGAIDEILDLVLQFVPTDIVSPFLNGNMIQIITISVSCGLVMLILGERVSELIRIVDQIYSIVQLLMEIIGHLVPLFIFMSIFSFMLSDNSVDLKSLLHPIIGILGSFVIMGLIVYPIILKVKYKIDYTQLMKKLLPTYIIAFTTASSAAAFSSNIDTCENSLGISNSITRFGVPLGQVVFMPFAAAEYLSISLALATMLDIQISVMWIVTAVFVSGILSIATPPIPGGAISIFTVLFLQLGIQDAVLPIALGIDILIDYAVTAGDIMCLQEELIICADKTGLLNKEKLLKRI